MTVLNDQTKPKSQAHIKSTAIWIYGLVGLYFGVVLVKSEAASWFRIQEMFKFASFHMYGLLGSAIFTGIVTTALLRRFGQTRTEDQIKIQSKEKAPARYIFGGIFFGLGWGLLGTCPGPIFVLIGAGYFPILIVFISALLGTYLYGLLRDKLPH